MGVELTIFKNETAFYVYWVFIDYSSQFEYANLGSSVSFGTNMKMKMSPAYNNYDEWNCYQLQFASELESCLGNANSGTMVAANDDDVAAKTEKATYATLSFGVINFVLIVVVVAMKQKVVYVSGGGGAQN